jgi:hypothetical protein
LLLTKSLTEQSALLNTVLYLLVKSSIAEDDDAEATSSIETHPVMLQLKRSNAILATLSETVFRKVDGLEDQIRNLVQAAALLSNDNGSKEHDEAFSEEERAAHGDDAVDVNDNDNETSMEESSLPEHPVGMEPGNSSRQRALAEARFGLRKHEVKLEINRKRRKAFSDFEFEAGESRDTKGLASTINAIDQRSSKKSKRSKDQPFGKELEYHDDEVAAGVRMMEAELEGGEKGLEIDGESGDFDDVDEHEEFDDHEFYDKMADAAKKKKQLKTEIHAVAPKFPTFEGEVEGKKATVVLGCRRVAIKLLTSCLLRKASAPSVEPSSKTVDLCRTRIALIEIPESRNECNIKKHLFAAKAQSERSEPTKATTTAKALVSKVESVEVESSNLKILEGSWSASIT